MHDYLRHWGAQRSPFRDLDWDDTPLLSAAAERLLSRLLLLCESDTSLVAITAPAGHGKTTFARHIHQTLATDRHEAVLVSLYKSEQHAGWLLPKLASFFQTHRKNAMPPHGEDDLTVVGRGLDEIIRERRRLVLIIDECHKLRTAEAFEEIHSLISLQSAVGPCLTTILIGTEELQASIEQAPAMRNRLGLRSHLAPLSEQECRDYVHYRLKLAEVSPSLFEQAAIVRLHQLSGGIYSLLNVLAESALMEAYLQKKRVVDEASVNAAGSYTSERQDEPRRGKVSEPSAPPEPPQRQREEVIPIQSAKKPPAAEPETPTQEKPSGIRLSSLFYKNKS